MAGFFGFFDYTKPGPGIDKDIERKKGAALFFELFFRKFWSYVKLNMLYAIASIPAFIIYVVIFQLFQQFYKTEVSVDELKNMLMFSAILAIMAVVVLGGGPGSAGYTYILRNYYREEHSWIWSDFWGQTFKNFKQGVVIWLLDSFVLFVLLFSIKFYYVNSKQQILYAVLMSIMIVFGVIFAGMHFYIWTMTVTFHLKLKQMYKNALLLSLLALPRTVGAMIMVVLYFALVFGFMPILAFILTPFIILAPIGLIIQILSYPVIRKYMIDPQEAKENADDGELGEGIEAERIGEGDDGEKAE